MKNSPELKLLVSTACILILSSCAGTQSGGRDTVSLCGSLKDYISGTAVTPDKGWSDGDTFRVITSGTPKPGIKDPAERKVYARRAAVLNAEYAAISEFKSIAGKGYENGDYFIQLIRKGKVACSYCSADDRCVVLYTVSVPSLKKTLMGLN